MQNSELRLLFPGVSEADEGGPQCVQIPLLVCGAVPRDISCVYREKGTGENITFEKADIIQKYIAHCFLRYVQPSPVVEHFRHLHGAHFSLASLNG